MLERGSPAAVLIGRWGAALSLVIGAVLIGRVIHNFPNLLPNRLPGLVLYELGPALVLTLAIGTAIAITGGSRPGIPARLALFALAALVAGTVTLAIEFDAVLQGNGSRGRVEGVPRGTPADAPRARRQPVRAAALPRRPAGAGEHQGRLPFRSRTTIDRPCNPPSVAPDALQGVGHARAARPRQR
jgi:hypothetical protein